MHIKSKRKMRISWLSAQPGLSSSPLPSDTLAPGNEDNPVTSMEIAGHRLSNFLAANNILWKSFCPANLEICTTACFRRCSWSRTYQRELPARWGGIRQGGSVGWSGASRGDLAGRG